MAEKQTRRLCDASCHSHSNRRRGEGAQQRRGAQHDGQGGRRRQRPAREPSLSAAPARPGRRSSSGAQPCLASPGHGQKTGGECASWSASAEPSGNSVPSRPTLSPHLLARCAAFRWRGLVDSGAQRRAADLERVGLRQRARLKRPRCQPI